MDFSFDRWDDYIDALSDELMEFGIADDGNINEYGVSIDRLIAPIDDSVALGRIVYQDAEGTVLAEIPLYADRSVEAFGWRDVFSAIAAAFLAGG